MKIIIVKVVFFFFFFFIGIVGVFSQKLTIESTNGKLSFCSGGSIILQVKGGYTSVITSYSWQQSASGTWNTLNNGITYNVVTNGDYRLVVQTGGAFDTSNTLTISVYSNPTINPFTFSGNNICASISISFTDKNPGMSYTWDFGDNITSNSQNPSHLFPQITGNGTNTYTVKETVIDGNGCQASTTNTLNIYQLPDPKLTDSIAIADLITPFSNCSSTSSNGIYKIVVTNASTPINDIVSYQIDWGDGTTPVSLTNFNSGIGHTYTQSGIYPIKFDVVNKRGCQKQLIQNVINQTNPALGLQGPPTGSTQGCAPQGWWFKCTNYGSNSLGTTYKWDFGDGDSLIWTTPLLVDSIFHVFKSASCGKGTNNEFTVSLTATNGCTSTPATISAIKLFKKPSSNFIIQSNPSCKNQSVSFTNSSILAYNSSDCNRNTIFTWDFGDGVLQNNTASTSLIHATHIYPNEGTYIAKLLAKGNCGTDTMTKTICVQSPPIPTFNLSSISTCTLFRDSLVNTTAPPICGSNSIKWKVTEVDSTCPKDSVNHCSLLVGSSTTDTFVVGFNNQGNFKVDLTVTNGCGSFTASQKQVYVKHKPKSSFNFTPVICLGQPFTPTATVNDCGVNNLTYNWDFSSSAVPSTSNQATPGTITYSQTGNYQISLTVKGDDCGPSTLIQNVTVAKSPDITTSLTDISVCGSAVVTIPSFTSSLSGTTFSWTNSNNLIGLKANGNGDISFTSGNVTVDQTAIITVTPVNGTSGCNGVAKTFKITVHPTPALPSVSTPLNYCQNAIASSLNVTPTAGNTLNWYSAANGGVPLGSAPTINTTNVGSTNFYVSQINSSSTCEGPRAVIVVNIKSSPSIGSITYSNPTNCQIGDGSFTIQGLAANTSFSGAYTFSGGSVPFSGTSDNSGNMVVGSLTGGTYSNIYVTLLNGCSSPPIAQVVLSNPGNPSTPSIAQNNVRLCSGALLKLSVASPSSALTYSWSKGSFIKDSTQLSINPVSVKDSGYYSVVANQNGCASAAATVHVAIDSTPAKPTITPVLALCLGNSLRLQAQSISDPIGTINYQWYGPNGFASFTKDTTILNANSNNGGTYKVWATNGNCVSDTTSINIAVRASLTQAAITGANDTLICNFAPPTNATQSVSGYLDNTRPYEKGKWTVIQKPANSNPLISNDSVPNTTVLFDKSGLYWIQWAISNDAGCSPTTDTIRFNVIDKPAITQSLVTKSVSVCASNPVTITIDTNSVFGQIKYWQIKRPYNASSWTDTLVQSPTITFNNVQDSFLVRLVVISKDTLHCGYDSATKDLQVNVAPPSNAGTAKGDTIVCSGNNGGNITLSGNTGTASWQSSTDSILYTNTSGIAGQLFPFSNLTQTTWFRSVVKSGTCDSVFSNVVKVTVVPAVTIANAGIDKSLCADSIYHLLANTPTSVETGTWTFATSDTGRLDNIHDPNTFIRGLKANTVYYLIWSINNHICASNQDTIIITNLNPLTNTIDTSTETKCNSASITVIGNTALGGDGNYTYQWEVKRGNTWYSIPSATTVSYSFIADTSVVLHRLVLAGPCTSTSLEKTIYVQPPLGNNFITGNTAACINTPVGLLQGSTPSGADGNFIYQWQQTADTIAVPWTNITGAAQKDFVAPILTQTTFYRRLVSSNLCSGSQSSTSPVFTVTVRPDAAAAWQILIDTACAPFAIEQSAVIPLVDTAKNGSYSWYAHDSLVGNSINSNPGYTLVPAGDSVRIKMVAVSRYGCKNDSLSHWFFTFPKPITQFTVSDTVGCGPLQIALNNTTPLINRFKYFWDFGNGDTSNLAQPGNIILQPHPLNKDTIYTIKLTAFTPCDTITVSKLVKVRARPKAIFAPSKTFGCSPLTDTFVNTSRGDSVTYTWQFGDLSSPFITKDTLPVFHTYNTGTQDTFTVKLIAANFCGIDTAQYAIVVAKSTILMNITVNGNELTTCRPGTVHFINTTKGASAFNWDFGDGNQATTFAKIGSLDTVVHVYDTVGIFQVKVRAFNNCTDTVGGLQLKVLSSPKAAFDATPDTVCIGHPITFTNQSDATTGFLWAFGDGTQSLLTRPTHGYAAAGNFNVRLIAIRQHTSANVCYDTTFRQVTVQSSLVGKMLVRDTISRCVPFTTTFNNLQKGAKTCNWDFNDGTTAQGNIITHTFTAVGNYWVTMKSVDTGGCTYEAKQLIQVNGPAGSFKYDHGIICGGTKVRFEALVTGTDSLKWNFGNGISLTTTDRIVYYQYPQSGKFIPSVTLLADVKGSCKVLLTGKDTITIDYVTSGFYTKSAQVCDATTVNFIDTSRGYLGLVSWQWDFGNGKTSTAQSPVQVYLTTNNWPIQLITTSVSGCSDTSNIGTYIKINNTPTASILADPTGCATQPVLYNAVVTSIDPATYFSWTFSNGTTGNTPTINAYYALAGTYTAKLIVGTAFGCYDTAAIATIKINTTPVVTTNPDFKLCKGASAFINSTGAPTYQWTPSAGLSCNTCPNPVASPITTTKYIVAGYNSFGCAGRDTLLVTVIQPFQLITSGNDTMCKGDAPHQLSVSGALQYNWFPSNGLSANNIGTPLANPPITTRYRIIGKDNDNCFADTAFLVVAVGTYPTVKLGQDQVLATGTLLPLAPKINLPTASAGPISQYNWTPTTDLSCENCPNPIATIKHDVCYSLVATNIYGCSSNADTICIKAFCENTQLFIPNAFTPDGDNVNDKLIVMGKGIRVIKSFRIYNRWGQVVFERANFQPNDAANGWDGKIKGVAAPPDVFVYTCEVVCENDVPFVYKGNIAILK